MLGKQIRALTAWGIHREITRQTKFFDAWASQFWLGMQMPMILFDLVFYSQSKCTELSSSVQQTSFKTKVKLKAYLGKSTISDEY